MAQGLSHEKITNKRNQWNFLLSFGNTYMAPIFALSLNEEFMMLTENKVSNGYNKESSKHSQLFICWRFTIRMSASDNILTSN